jgi:CDGSH-type Zn-finger protein
LTDIARFGIFQKWPFPPGFKDIPMSDPAVPQKKPYVMEMQPGEYWWCSCGHSKTQPFCDGSHSASGTGLSPVRVAIDAPRKVAWCGCKHSAKPPFCDGSHKNLP